MIGVHYLIIRNMSALGERIDCKTVDRSGYMHLTLRWHTRQFIGTPEGAYTLANGTKCMTTAATVQQR